MPKTDLVEPTGEPVKTDAQISPSGVAAKASEVDTSQSASASLFRQMQELPPSKPTDLQQTAAQKASAQPSEEPAEKKEFPAIGKSDVKEHKQVETPADEKPEVGSALESFRKGHANARREKRAKLDGDAKTEEKQEEPRNESQTEEPKKKEDDDAPVTAEEIEQTIADPGISKRHQKRMIHLANRAKELESKLKELEAKPQTAANDTKIAELEEKQKAAEKELIQFRRRYSIESEPELKKFDETVTKADEAILTKLKDAGLSDKTLELIKGMGGFEGFSRSTQTFTVNAKDPETGELKPTVVTGAQLARQWLNDMNVADAEYVKSKLAERFGAIDGKKRRTDELVSGAETWFKEQQENYNKAIEAENKRATEYRTGYEQKITKFLEGLEELKDKTVSPTATPEEKKEAEEHNRFNAGVRALAKAAVHPATLDDHVAVVQEAAKSLIHSRENKQLKKEIAQLKEQLTRVQKGFSTTGKGGGNSILTASKPKDTSAASQLATSAADSLREGMEKLRNGGGNDE